jgi:glycosyltransferase involved in cell wall biosynthesis
MKYTNKIIAISNFVKESVIECFHVSKEKINVIYNGVNTDRFIRIKLPENRNTIVEIIYIGRLYKEKGVQNILKALSRLDINYYFRIVGDGLYRDKLEDITEQYNLKDKVEFCGKRTNVPELLWQSDIFIHMPDLEEGFGISVIEAMAAGKVCIVANSGAMSEIITDGVNGFMVEKGNIQELSEKINEVAVQINTDVIKKIRENAVNRAKDFSIEIFTKQLDDVLKINS